MEEPTGRDRDTWTMQFCRKPRCRATAKGWEERRRDRAERAKTVEHWRTLSFSAMCPRATLYLRPNAIPLSSIGASRPVCPTNIHARARLPMQMQMQMQRHTRTRRRYRHKVHDDGSMRSRRPKRPISPSGRTERGSNHAPNLTDDRNQCESRIDNPHLTPPLSAVTLTSPGRVPAPSLSAGVWSMELGEEAKRLYAWRRHEAVIS